MLSTAGRLAKRVLRALAPSFSERISQIRKRRADSIVHLMSARVVEAIVSKSGYVVHAGPFQGMRYVQRTSWSALGPKLLGIYERELHTSVRQMVRESFDVVINIGCAEGYYAVGFALASPSSTIVAYDLDPQARQLCGEMATLNGVSDRISIRGECTHASLRADLKGRSLVVCDCEGAELQLLDPSVCPELVYADILVELHEFVIPGLTDELLSRFRETHAISRIPAQPATTELAAGLPLRNADDRLYAVSEFRPPGMEWAVLRPLTAKAR